MREWLTWRRLALAVALVALPGWLMVNGPPQRVWARTSLRLLEGYPIYDIAPTPHNAHSTRYVYLPTFAMANAALLSLPDTIMQVIGASLDARKTLGYLLTGLWGYVGLGALAIASVAYTRVFASRRAHIAAVVAVGLPAFFAAATFRGADLLVAACLVGSLATLHRGRYGDAGLLISVATFKFTAIPAAIALSAVVLGRADWDGRRHYVAGGLLGQLPNVVYFAADPWALAYIIEHRGALSTYATRIGDFHTLLLPVRAAGVEAAYITWGFPLAILVLTAAGAILAWRTAPFAAVGVGYFPMAYLIPAERRYVPMLALLAVACVVLWEREWARWAVVALATTQAFAFIFTQFGEHWAPLVPLRGLYVQAIPLVHLAIIAAVLTVLWRHRGWPA